MFFEQKVNRINDILKGLGNGAVAVWCVGVHTEKLAAYTGLLKTNISFFVDRNADSFAGHEVYGRPVYDPMEADFSSIDYIIISTYKYQKDILAFLNQRELSKKAVTCYVEEDEGEFYLLPQKNQKDFYFSGRYDSWTEAAQHAIGYQDRSIVRKVLDATKQVMDGKACFERDSVLFYHKEFNFRLISIFGLLASRKHHIDILDFGGALGSEYWKNREFLYKFGVKFTWNIVEQEHYVEIGKREISNGELRFYSNISQLERRPDLLILSGVLQFLPDYKEIFSELLDLKPRYILIDRQVVSEQTRICVQYVMANIYQASYPVRIIAEQELMDFFGDGYCKLIEFVSEADGDRDYVDGKEVRYKGYLMERKENENT